jgi:hypothetical protein
MVWPNHVLVEVIQGHGRQAKGGMIDRDLEGSCWPEDKKGGQTAAEQSPIASNQQVDLLA